MSQLQEHVEQSIRERKLFRRGERILVAVSGGVDSMALLHLLQPSVTRGWKLAVAHFNHKLRGRSSDADERLVRQAAAGFGLPFFAGRGSVRTLASKRGESIEMVARALRHKFFARTAKQMGIRTIALAHHADDQVELFFLRLLRGTGSEGIAGMKWVSPSPANAEVRVVRPLLDVSRADLEQFARENRVRFREDTSNASRDFLRNRIRHDLLPLLRRRFQPALNQTVLRFMEITGEEAQFMDATARVWLKNHRPSFGRLPISIARRVLQLQLQHLKLQPDFGLIESLRLSPGKSLAINPLAKVTRDPAGHVSIAFRPSVRFQRGRQRINLATKSGHGSFGGLEYRWRIADHEGSQRPPQTRGTELFDADKIGKRIVLRHWRPGDRFHPIGAQASVKLQDWFTNLKIPRERRHELVIATTEQGEIFWVEDQRIGGLFKLTSETARRLIWRWQRH